MSPNCPSHKDLCISTTKPTLHYINHKVSTFLCVFNRRTLKYKILQRSKDQVKRTFHNMLFLFLEAEQKKKKKEGTKIQETSFENQNRSQSRSFSPKKRKSRQCLVAEKIQQKHNNFCPSEYESSIASTFRRKKMRIF